MRFWIDAFAASLAFLFGLMPQPVRNELARGLAWLWFDALKIRRFTVLKNISIAFPEKTKAERMRIARESMRHLCSNFIEFTLLPQMDQQWLKNQVVFHGLENYDKALEQKKGLLVLSLHLGNGDVGIAALALRGIRLHVISKKFKNAILNEFWFGVREEKGTRFLEAHGRSLSFDILKALRANEAVVFVIDQFMGKPYGIETRFFGRKTGSPYGLSLFALKTQAPVLPMYTYRDEQFRTHVVIGAPVSWGPFSPEENKDKDLQTAKMTQKYNHEVESIIRQHPEQWMWLHRRWKTWE